MDTPNNHKPFFPRSLLIAMVAICSVVVARGSLSLRCYLLSAGFVVFCVLAGFARRLKVARWFRQLLSGTAFAVAFWCVMSAMQNLTSIWHPIAIGVGWAMLMFGDDGVTGGHKVSSAKLPPSSDRATKTV